jgi:hypothetical protein
MEPVEKCTSALSPLIVAGHTNCIPLAEKAIDDMLLAIHLLNTKPRWITCDWS